MNCFADDTIQNNFRELMDVKQTYEKAEVIGDNPEIINAKRESLLKANQKYKAAVSDWIRNSNPGES
jgi:ABC-type taurine transport system substrate-binding protein